MRFPSLESPKTALWLAIGVAVLLCALYASLAVRSPATYYDDDVQHYLIAHYAWQHPWLFLDTWGRPAFTVLYAPAAALGLLATRLWSALLAGLVCLLSALCAREWGVRWWWAAALLVGLQPEFIRQGYSCLTELTFLGLLALSLYGYKRQNWLLVGVSAAFFAVARYETIPLVLIYGFILWRHGRWWMVPLLAVPMLVQNGSWALYHGSASYLLFPLDQALGLRPGAAQMDYGVAGPSAYLKLIPAVFGGMVLVLAGVGFVRERFGLLHLFTVVNITVLLLLRSLVPSAGVGFDARYLAISAVPVGILAVQGLERLGDGKAGWGWIVALIISAGLGLALWYEGMIVAAIFAALVAILCAYDRFPELVWKIGRLGIVLAVMATTVPQVRPFELDAEHKQVIAAAEWYKAGGYSRRLVLASHMWFIYAVGLDYYDQRECQPITPENIGEAPAGSIIVWDSHYSDRLVWHTPLFLLEDGRKFKLIRVWSEGDFRVLVFEKL